MYCRRRSRRTRRRDAAQAPGLQEALQEEELEECLEESQVLLEEGAGGLGDVTRSRRWDCRRRGRGGK